MPYNAVTMVDSHAVAPQRVVPYLCDSALVHRLDRLAKVSFDINSIMGFPVAESFRLHKFAIRKRL